MNIGDKFGQLTIKKIAHINKNDNRPVYLCQCSCGNYIDVKECDLESGKVTACKDPACKNSLIGQTFGEWTVIAHDKSKHNHDWCICSCGTKKSVDRYCLRTGQSKSCGCKRTWPKEAHEKAAEASKQRHLQNATEQIGKKYGKLTVLKPVLKTLNDGSNRYFYECQCDCGNIVTVNGHNLFNGHTISCGCINSKANELMAKILDSYGVKYQREYRFSDCKDKSPLPFDFCLFNNSDEVIGLIENNGIQHYSQFGTSWDTPERLIERQKHDYIKQKFAEDAKIPLLIIPYQFFNELEKFLTTSEFWQIISKQLND